MVLAKYPKVLELAKLEGKKGFKFTGRNLYQFFITSSDHSGMSVSYIGDINDDGWGDIAIGAPGATTPFSSNEAGECYVVFGNSSLPQYPIDLSSLDGYNGFVLAGGAPGIMMGFSVSAAGDFNGDGIDDMVLGGPGSGNFEISQSYIVFGKRGVWENTLFLSNLDGSNGVALIGDAYTASGLSVGNAGDLNGDGINDIIIGAPFALNQIGQSYVVFGKHGTWSSSFSLSNLDGSNGFLVNGMVVGDQNGWAVNGIGDLNGDGISDIVVESSGAFLNVGQNYVVFGKRGIWSSPFLLTSLDGSNGFTLNSATNITSCISVSSAGDVNGDGLDDVIMGVPQREFSATGQSYVLFGKTSAWSSTFSLSDLDGSNGFVIHGVNLGDNSGHAVSSAGDVNGDGIGDILIGAPALRNDQPGQSYVIFGKRGAWAQNFLLSSLDGTNGFMINGIATGDDTGYSVSAEDINGDGISDLFVGAPGASPNGLSGAGTTYIILNATNSAPWFINSTQLTVAQGQIQLFSSQNIQASDDWTLDENLQFTISNLYAGRFIASGIETLTFSQGDVINEKVLFVQDNSNHAPSFNVTVSDGILSTGPQSAVINFIPTPTSPLSSNNNTRTTIIAGVVGGLAGAGIFGALYLRSRAKRQLEETINALGTGANGLPSDFQRTVLLPIAKAIFEQIKITGFMYYINQSTTTAYVQAIEKVVEELQKQGMDFDLKRRGSTADQEKLFKTIADEIRRQVLPRQGRCSTHPFTRFFCAEVTPTQIQDKAARIASQVQLNLPLIETNEIERGSRLE